MRVAILDLGTNVFNLLIADIFGNGFKLLKIIKKPSKIGAGGINKGLLREEAFVTTERVISEMLDEIAAVGHVDLLRAFATSAVRSASNGKEFVNMVKEKFGIDVEVISGDREAELIYKGVRESILIYDEKALIMDIGGGSTEFIIGNSKDIFWKHSFDLGAIRLKERFEPSDPIEVVEILKIEEYLHNQLLPLWSNIRKYTPSLLIGCSGSFDTLRELIYVKDDMSLPAKELELPLLLLLFDKLVKSTSEERSAMVNMSPLRVDHIVVGALLVDIVLKETGIKSVYQSSFSLKEGFVAEVCEEMRES